MSAARRLVLGSLVWSCVVFGASMVCSAVVFAAAPETPSLEVSSRKASEVGLRGVLYPNAIGEPGSYEFLYKQSASECGGESKTASGVVTGNQFQEVFETLTGLQEGKQYTICLAVTSPGGTTLSPPVTVTTAIAPETPEGLKAEAVAATSATLEGILNPLAERKSEPGTYEFLYKQSASECEGENTTSPTGGVGAKQEAVSAPAAELLAHTTYTFCLRETNGVGESATSAPVSFTTPTAAPLIEEASVGYVTSGSATFSAKINPQGAETSYAFEYAPAGGSFAPVPEAEGKGILPEGAAGVTVGVHVQVGLAAHTAYQFRVVAVNSVETVTGTPVSFTTQTLGVASGLPDGRQWEMVSPPQKEGVQLGHIEEGIIQAAADGNAFSDWSLFEPIEEKAAGTYGLTEANYFGRGPDGWVSKTITPPHSASGPPSVGRGMEYRFFSEDLSKAILQPFGRATPLAPGVSQSTSYIRTDYLNGSPGELCGSGCYQPLVSDANVPAGTQYGEEENGPCISVYCGPLVVVTTPDLSHVLLSSTVALTAGSHVERSTQTGVYEWAGGKLTFVGLTPRGGGGLGSGGVMRHAISDDGSRVVLNGSYEGVEGLLLRDTMTGETTRLDVAQGSGLPPVPPGQAGFETASSDESRVFFVSAQPLTEDASGPALYEYNLNAPVGSRLTDLSVDGNAGEAAGVSAVLGASEDGSYVYFAATGVLAPGASPGRCGNELESGEALCNVYVRHDGATRLVAALSAEDFPVWYSNRGYGFAARVSPNGQWLALMSSRKLTGYDTTDAASGRPDEEVYLYDASTGKLVCASCNPTGARPVGVEDVYTEPTFVNPTGSFGSGGTWIAANIPPWTSYELGAASYQSRYLSNSGRLFFDSHDALVPQDVNGTQDVYEYEPGGVGDCDTSRVTFSELSGGCMSLISSGESNEESAFLDASETGGDIFFLTSSKLAPRDFDNAFDVYDARECGSGQSRCFATEPVSPPPCSTGDSCKPSPTLQPAIFGSPSSATFSGAGNITPSTATSLLKPKALTRAQRLARALKKCSRKKGKRRRACERQAQARYGAKQSRKANATKRSGR